MQNPGRFTGLSRLTSHGLRHSPEMLMNTYSHTLPRSQNAVVTRLVRN